MENRDGVPAVAHFIDWQNAAIGLGVVLVAQTSPCEPISDVPDQTLSRHQEMRVMMVTIVNQGAAPSMSHHRNREPRVTVRLRARLKSDVGWGDMHICNVSSRGMMIRNAPLPPLGSYVEICRGPVSIVARVRWLGHDQFGVQSVEPIDLEALRDPAAVPIARNGDRRRTDRSIPARHPPTRNFAEQLASSERLGRHLQFLAAVGAAVMMALVAVDIMTSAFASPLEEVRLALQAGSSPT